MTTIAPERETRRRRPRGGCDRSSAGERREAGASGGVKGEPTLDDVIVGAWEGLAGHAAARCPLCGGTLERRPAGASDRFLGRCRDCGTTLA